MLVCSISLLRRWIFYRRVSWAELPASAFGFVVGLYAIVLDGHSCSGCLREARANIVRNAAYFGKVSGRGVLYALAGLAQFSVFRPLYFVVGLFSVAVGTYLVKMGRQAEAALCTLRTSITNETALLRAFQVNDHNGDGKLEMFEFEGLVLALGIELDSDELDAAFGSIDINNDRYIVYDEFREWWKRCTTEAQEKASAAVPSIV